MIGQGKKAGWGRPVHVLVVDDNAELLDALALVLKSAGHDVEIASSAALALSAQRTRPAEVVITDIFMPDTDGLEAVAAFRAGWPGLKIVAMSGGGRLAQGSYLETARVVGADALLHKPFAPERLLAMLDSFRSPS
jgi:CheY-like chemotaxis protein